MEFDEAALVRELKPLRAGAGARDPAQLERLTPLLELVCGITDQDPPRRREAKLRGTVEVLLGNRPELRISLLAVLGLHPKAQQETPGKRLESVESEIRGSRSTVYRRADEAIAVIAQLAVADARASSAAAQQPGFTLDSICSEIVFRGDRPSFVERRRIRVTAEELLAIPCAFAILEPPPGHEPELHIDVTSEAIRCEDIQLLSCGAVKYLVRLWKPLRRGDTFEFTVRFALPDGRLMAPFYVLSPMTTVRAADLRVTFDPTHLPARVRRLDGVLPAEVEHWPPDSSDRLDPSGRIDASFVLLQQGWCYGIAWSWT